MIQNTEIRVIIESDVRVEGYQGEKLKICLQDARVGLSSCLESNLDVSCTTVELYRRAIAVYGHFWNLTSQSKATIKICNEVDSSFRVEGYLGDCHKITVGNGQVSYIHSISSAVEKAQAEVELYSQAIKIYNYALQAGQSK